MKEDKLIGEIGGGARDLSDNDLKNGAVPYDKWSEGDKKELRKLLWQLLLPAEEAGLQQTLPALLYEKIKDEGIGQIRAIVEKGNTASNRTVRSCRMVRRKNI